ncbi:MAG: hypothetical protein HQL11_04435, partial [Candidatus Omnitrophica bacterium]|nr:hypothetical protein [Candidatus Omnitrophota bacterium]
MCRTYRHLNRILALVLCVAFLGGEFVFAAPRATTASHPSGASIISRNLGLDPATARVEQVFSPKDLNQSNRTIYLLQDAHTNASGQLNLSGALDQLFGIRPELRHIFIEAGSGDNSIAYVRRYGDTEARRRLALQYLRKGELHGEEHFQITTDRSVEVWGVEDLVLYRKALAIYRRIVDLRFRSSAAIGRLASTLTELKSAVYSPYLQDLDKARTEYLGGNLGFPDYVSVLAGAGVDLKDYPQCRRIRGIQRMQNRLDAGSRKPEEGRTDGLDMFQPVAAGRAGGEHNAAGTPKMTAGYRRCLKASQRVNPVQALRELDRLERAVFDKCAYTERERTLAACSRMFEDLKSLAALKLTPEGFRTLGEREAYRAPRRLWGALNRMIMDLGRFEERALFDDRSLEWMLKLGTDFYDLTRDRDRAMVDRALERLTASGAKEAVLIAGGYHADHLKEILAKRGIGFVSIIPSVYEETDGARYERLLLGQLEGPQGKRLAEARGEPDSREESQKSNAYALRTLSHGLPWNDDVVLTFVAALKETGSPEVPAFKTYRRFMDRLMFWRKPRFGGDHNRGFEQFIVEQVRKAASAAGLDFEATLGSDASATLERAIGHLTINLALNEYDYE